MPRFGNSTLMSIDSDVLDLCGIGLGPSNLSLAALLAPLDDVEKVFLEARPSFSWHPGMLLPGAQLQVSFLKDLVTTVDPTSRYSFLNFLAQHQRMYRFLIARRDAPVTREEFQQYYAWVARSLPFVRFGQRVGAVEHDGDSFVVRVGQQRQVRARNLVVGVGHQPFVPACATGLGPQVIHASEFGTADPPTAGRRVVVVGGGQSGAEIVDHLLGRGDELPVHITWVARQHGFLPLDDSAFANEWFNPQFVHQYFQLPDQVRRRLLERQRTASNGISEGLLERIYRRLYEVDYLSAARVAYRLRTSTELVGLTRTGQGLRVTLDDLISRQRETLDADLVVLATGYQHVVPDFLRPLLGADDLADVKTNLDYSVRWKGAALGAIYLQNGAEHTHGIADPNLSLGPWRSATIVNSLLGREVYRTGAAESALWPAAGAAGSSADGKEAPLIVSLAKELTERTDEGDELHLIDLTSATDLPTAPFQASWWTVSPGSATQVDRHDAHEIWLVSAGVGRFTCGDETAEVRGGDVLRIPPDTAHRIENHGTEVLSVYSVWWG
ncbi:SidA/IucD/PvdA family monooxygenase [Dactylosporangium sp. NPDC050588]|uniref:SidA/IucD/PvdA family monooxygenase n=1 Tax=Dactylosporangium sp. NPDC050588 TaxID=3157211 RepID=UPI0033E4F062